MKFKLDGRTVTFKKTKKNVDALEQVIHPMAVVNLKMTKNGQSLITGNYQLDGPNQEKRIHFFFKFGIEFQ